jgi:hypothetical protein
VDILNIHAKNPDYRGRLCSLKGMKIHTAGSGKLPTVNKAKKGERR